VGRKATPAKPQGRVSYYLRGFEDGRAGAMRATGPEQYHIGYDDGLDAYDEANREQI
jgi:hypothetical protein